MAVTRRTPAPTGGAHSGGTSQAAATTATPSSVFGSGKASTNSALSIPLKRKMTDQALETINVDPMYDLTLIVGSPEHTKGQKAFQVSKGSFRNISAVWTKMLNGNWAESSQSEICLPDDSCDAFHIVLLIAHFQLSDLPEKLSREELVDLAVLADKYQLGNAIKMTLELKRWMHSHKQLYMSRPSDAALQDFAVITSAFNLRSDFEYIASRLATELEVDSHGKFNYRDVQKRSIMLRSDLPTSVSGEIERIRSDILSAWINCCNAGLTECMGPSLPPCKQALCAATKAGVLLKGLKTAGFCPSPSSATLMHGSVVAYWKLLNSIGNEHHQYRPCDFIKGTHRASAHLSSHAFVTCFGDFGIKDVAREVLERHIHEDLRKQWKDDKSL